GLSALQLRSSHQQIETTERSRLAHQGRIVEQMLGARLQATANALDELRADALVLLPQSDGLARLNDRMRLMISSMVGVRTFILVDRTGIGIASNRKELVGLDYHEGERYRTIRSRPDPSELYVSPPFTTPLGAWALSLGRVVLDEQGAFDGYLLAIIDPEYFNLLLDSTRYAPDMSAALTHGGGLIIYRVPEVKGAVGMNLAEMPDALFNKHVRSGESLTAWTGALKTTGKDALMVFQTIRPARSLSDGFLVASFTRDTDAMFASWRKEVRDRVALLLVIALASTFGLVFIQRRRAATARSRAMQEAERSRADAALQASEAKYRHLFESLMDGFVVVGTDGVIREFNEEYRKMLGYSADELANTANKEITPERWHPVEERIVADQVIPRGYSDVYEKEYRRKDGTVFPVELRTFLLRKDGRPDAMWSIVRDVSAVRLLQVQLSLASRLAAMGTLVAGVAHEVNNPLAAVLADRGMASEVVQEVRDRLRTSDPVDREAEAKRLDGVIEALEDAEAGGRRIEQIVKDLAKFARPSDEKTRVRLVDAAQQAMRWLPASVGRTATVSVEDGNAPDVLASFGQIEQVVVNLVTNAAKASKPGERGVVIVRTSPGSPGMSRLEVIDNGVGIDPAIRNRIFDPFFTTRQVGEGKGMGLGLSICHSIVTRHGGSLNVESEVGKGSTFRMELPVAPAEA
ncbi:MAG TPA: ATP-binding protein, partial [Anaeromyxobacteraceae bacterium]|nr:ATP-binding protein [Anaeromyxobacteraceae bacterium]